MVTAKELFDIACNDRLHRLLEYAKKCALEGQFSVITRLTISDNEVEVLKELGFTVRQEDECLVVTW